MMNQAWDDAYHELWKHAAHHRGLREAAGELPGHTLSHSLRQWPRTCGADVVAIAAVVDPVLRAAPLDAGGYGVERRWHHCTTELTDAALRDPDREFRHNRSFWSTLASIAAYLASVDAPVPGPMWQALFSEVASREPAHRNTAVVDERLHLAAFAYDELWQAQRTALAKLRGADARDPGPNTRGLRMTVPRTTKADILQLATYWTDALAHVEHKRREMGPHGPQVLHYIGLDGDIQRWRAVLADVDTYATSGDPSGLYPKNEAFWRASAHISITVAVIDDAPPPFEMLLDTIIQRPNLERRNASYPGEGTFEKRWNQLHDDFIASRGSDLRDPLPGRVGRPMKVPRTLNAEITKVAEFWNAAWKKLEGRRGIFGNIPGEEIGLDTLKKRWLEVMKDVGELAEKSKVEDVYPKNHEFWRETHDLAVTLDIYNEIPTRLDIALDIGKTLPDRFANVVGQIAHAVGDVANKAGEGLATGLGKSILIGGSVLLGGVLIWRWIRPGSRTAEAA